MDSLSLKQAQKLALLSQGVLTGAERGRTGTLNAIERIGYVQIDSISVVSRAHHHTLWNRVKNYRPDYLDQLVKEKAVFEYWSHAAAYLPMSDYRFSLYDKQAIAQGRRHWFSRDDKVIQNVLARIASEGPLQARDFQKPEGHKGDWWGWKPAKQALEQLYMEGRLMCPYRVGFQKVYDLTERVVPERMNLSVPTAEEMADHLIHRYLDSHGFGTLAEIGYLRKGLKSAIKSRVEQLLEEGILRQVKVGEFVCVTRQDLLERLARPLRRTKVSLLSPFDNLVIQRKRVTNLFGFDYQIECYVPAPKRQYGYYALPVLWRGELVARLDAKAHRSEGRFVVNNLVCELGFNVSEAFLSEMVKTLREYAEFNQCQDIVVTRTSPSSLCHELNRCLSAGEP